MEKLMTSCCPASRNLLKYLDKWKKSPQLEIDLGYELDCFIPQFQEQQEDVENFTPNDFAEVAIFVQNYALLYEKKVDLLLKSFLQLHTALCDISSKSVNENEEKNSQSDKTETSNETIDQIKKNKKKKKDNPEPKENSALEPQPSTSHALTTAEVNSLTQENKELFSEKELEEIGVLWKMLNKIEKHRIENIINNLDENHGIESIVEEVENEQKTLETAGKEMCIDSNQLFDVTADDEDVFDDSVVEEPKDYENTESVILNELNANELRVTLNRIDDVSNTESLEPCEKQNDKEIENGAESLESTNPIDAKVVTLKEVQIRLKRLTHEEIYENSSSYRRKCKKPKPDPFEVKNNYYEREMREIACLDCTGCTALKNISNLNNISSEAQKKEQIMKIPVRKNLRKRPLSQEDLSLNKKIKLNTKIIRAPAKDFDHFYEKCYKNLKWIDGDLTVDTEYILNISSTTDTSDITPNNIVSNHVSDDEAAEVCHEILNTIIDKVSIIDETSEEVNIRFSQESGFSEDFFSDDLSENQTQNETDLENQTQIEKELEHISENQHSEDAEVANISDPSTTNIDTNTDGMLSPAYFYPHTPAHSEDSGRFSSAAYHSDLECENTNRAIHNDSGIEMSHHSDDEDDNMSGIMPFKDVDPSALSFYKKKCESLLEQRERDQKMREWEKFLKDKESRKKNLPEFHIDEYETKILNSLPDDSTKAVTFDTFIEGKSPEEIARYFVATLQLANMNNVLISDNEHKEDASNKSFKITLKSKERYFQNIETSDSFMDNLSNKPFSTSTPFKAPKQKFKKRKY